MNKGYEDGLEVIEIPRCKKCSALQAQITRPYYERCWVCNSELNNITFKEVKICSSAHTAKRK